MREILNILNEDESFTSRPDWIEWANAHNAHKQDHNFNSWTITDRGVSVSGDVHIKTEKNAPIPFKFHEIDGDFSLFSYESTSLPENMPLVVTGDLDVASCKKLESLMNCSAEVYGGFYAYGTQIKSLDGGPDDCKGVYHVADTPSLISLSGSPKRLFDCNFRVYNTSIPNLEGGPKIVGAGSYWCGRNDKLVSLKGCPKRCMQLYCQGSPNLSPWEMRHVLMTNITNEFRCDSDEVSQTINSYMKMNDSEKKREIPKMLAFLKRF